MNISENTHIVSAFGPQAGGSVSGEIGVTGASGKDHHTTFLEMPGRSPADIWFGDRLHGNGRHHPGNDADAFKSVLHREAVHNRGQHAHVIGGSPIHALAGPCDPTEDVTGADNQTIGRKCFHIYII